MKALKILKKVLMKLLELAFRAAIVTILIIPTAEAIIDAAYAERGYSAVGGEWILIIIITGALWMLSGGIYHCFAFDREQKGSEKF